MKPAVVLTAFPPGHPMPPAHRHGAPRRRTRLLTPRGRAWLVAVLAALAIMALEALR